MTVFGDTGYWIALLNPKDDLHGRAEEASSALGDRRIVTTDFVLTEVLNFYAKRGSAMRDAACRLVRMLLGNSRVEVVAATRDAFVEGLQLYSKRSDKRYSHVDCVSFELMRKRRIQDALTADVEFEQEGFKSLLRTGSA